AARLGYLWWSVFRRYDRPASPRCPSPVDVPALIARQLKALPDTPGVYLWKNAAGEIVYVGKAKSLRARVPSYFGPEGDSTPERAALVRQIAELETIIAPTEAQALLLENNLIKEHKPRFNIRLTDDKSYPRIAVTLGEPFPRVLVVRRVAMAGARFFGPYTDVATLRQTLRIIRRIFTVRSCHWDRTGRRRRGRARARRRRRVRRGTAGARRQADRARPLVPRERGARDRRSDPRRLPGALLSAAGGPGSAGAAAVPPGRPRLPHRAGARRGLARAAARQRRQARRAGGPERALPAGRLEDRELRHRRASGRSRVRAGPRPRARRRAARVRVYRHLDQPGTRHGGLAGLVRGRSPQEGGVPALPDPGRPPGRFRGRARGGDALSHPPPRRGEAAP